MKYPIYILTFIAFLGCKGPDAPEQVISADESASNSFTEAEFNAAGLSFIKPVKQNFGESITVSGFIDVPPEGRASISPYYSGYVKQISLLPGQQVKKSEILVVLEHPDYIMMQRDYIQAKEELAFLKDDFERQKTLLAENINSRKSYLKAESEYKQTQAKYEALREQLTMLGFNLGAVESGRFSSEVKLKSPIDGFVTEVYVVKGQFLPAAQKAVDLINTAHLHLELNVFEKDLPLVKEDQQVIVQLPGMNHPLSATVYLVGKEILGEERTARVHAHFEDNQVPELSPGMFLESEIIIEEDWRLAIPQHLVKNGEIQVTGSSGWPIEVIKVPVKTGLSKNNFLELTDSLQSNYRIIDGL